jgi:hypothetical protein
VTAFDSRIPCRAHAMIRPCRFASFFSRPRHSTAGTLHRMCELTLTVCRRPVGDLPSFGFFRLPRGVSRLAIRIFPPTRGLLRRIRQCRRTAWPQHGMCELARHGTAWARHGMCELAFTSPVKCGYIYEFVSVLGRLI